MATACNGSIAAASSVVVLLVIGNIAVGKAESRASSAACATIPRRQSNVPGQVVVDFDEPG